MVDLWVEIVSLAVLIGLSGFFSGLEVALVGMISNIDPFNQPAVEEVKIRTKKILS